jgi:hypothetical protein
VSRVASGAPELLVGDWEFTTRVAGQVIGHGRTTFEWIEDGSFLRQTAHGWEDAPPDWKANSPMPTTAIIGFDDDNNAATMLYADARGVRRVYQTRFAEATWTVWRDAPGFNQRFSADIGADGRTMRGRWEASAHGSTWEVDFENEYTKVGEAS